MILTLEALQAKHGDSLILHFGAADAPKFLVIDGGPGGVYRRALKKRLLQIRDRFVPDDPLPLSMVMISHMDDDHVNGVLDLTEELRNAGAAGDQPLFDLQHLWFNAFDDIVGNRELPRVAGLGSTASVADLIGIIPEMGAVDHHAAAVVASTGQGRQLRNDAELLIVPVNSPFEPASPDKAALVRGDTAGSLVEWDDGLKIHVLHPDEKRLREMEEKWDRDLRKFREDGDESVIIAGFQDTSPFNLASIVALVELEGKRVLLTGDARGDDILDGLHRADLLDDDGHIHVDVLKIPHHGSDRNVATSFFRRVTADHYVISGNGEHHNPDRATLVMLSIATRGRNDFTIHLTNHDGKHDLKETLDEFIEDDRNRGRTYGVNFRDEDDLSLKVDLLDPIDY